MSFHEKTIDAAKGKWRGILLALGVPPSALTGKHGPCPLCGGVDRFRWDNKEGSGSYICGQCGAGTGMQFAMSFTGQQFRDVAAQIDSLLGNEKIGTDKVRPQMTGDQVMAALREVAAATVRITQGDLVDTYLRMRRLGQAVYPKALRFAAAIRDGDGGTRPAMVATVQGPDGVNVSLHRTFLRPNGIAKADMPSPRKLMPGAIPDGASVRLSEYTGGPIGIAEGIETALAATCRFEVPCWAAINATMLAKWVPPDGCREVAIFADNDANFAGLAAAYRLANRLAVRGIAATVHTPPNVGDDWADVWLAENKEPA